MTAREYLKQARKPDHCGIMARAVLKRKAAKASANRHGWKAFRMHTALNMATAGNRHALWRINFPVTMI